VANVSDNIDLQNISDASDIESIEENESDKIETGSRVARSIISNIFRRFDTKSTAEENANVIEHLEDAHELEILQGGEKLQDIERHNMILRSSSPASSSVEPAGAQSPRTAARVSNWINDLESEVVNDEDSLPRTPHKTRMSSDVGYSKENTSSVGCDNDCAVDPSSEDDQPSGFTTPAGRMNVSSFGSPGETPRLNLTSTPFITKLSHSQGNSYPDANGLDPVWDVQNGGEVGLFKRGAVSEAEYRPRNHYMKIVETTRQTLERGEDGQQTLNTVHTLEKEEKNLDEPLLGGRRLLLLALFGLILVILHFEDVLTFNSECLSGIKKITNQTNGGIFSQS